MTSVPLPIPVVERLPQPLVAEHERLVARHRDTARKVARLDGELRAAREADAEAEAEAVKGSRKLPTAKADALEAKLREAEREERALRRAVAATRNDLYEEISDDVLREVGAETRDRELAAMERAVAAIADVEDAIVAANREAQVRMWCVIQAQRTAPIGDYADGSSYDLPSGPTIRAELDRRLRQAQGGETEPQGFRVENIGAGHLSG
jgi:hypothetical protein